MKLFDRFSGPPTEAKFAKILVDALRRGGDDRQYAYDPSQSRLTVSKDGESVGVVNLRNLHSIFCGLSKQERPEWLKKTCISFFNRMEIPTEFEDVKADLRPTVRSRLMLDLYRLDAEAEDGKPFEIPSVHVSEHLVACLVYDLPHAMRFVGQKDLDAWGVSVYEAMEVARHNLDEQQPGTFASLGDKLYIFQTGDAYDGTRMLMLDLIRSLKVDGNPVALPITRDCLMVTGSDDIDGQRMMAELAEKQMSGPRPLCSIPHVLVGDEWEPWRPALGNPQFGKFHLLEMQHWGSEYAEQTELLNRRNQKLGVDVFVASYSAFNRNRVDASFCVWTKGIPTWLPKTDMVAFADPETKMTKLVIWGRVVAELGHLMEPLDYWPPRWSVTEFPSIEQLEKIAVEQA